MVEAIYEPGTITKSSIILDKTIPIDLTLQGAPMHPHTYDRLLMPCAKTHIPRKSHLHLGWQRDRLRTFKRYKASPGSDPIEFNTNRESAHRSELDSTIWMRGYNWLEPQTRNNSLLRKICMRAIGGTPLTVK